jgi:DNA-binding NtrC family response regulator
MHPWTELQWKPIADAANRILSLFVQAQTLETQLQLRVAPESIVAPPLPAFRLEGEYAPLLGVTSPCAFRVNYENNSISHLDDKRKAEREFRIGLPETEWRPDVRTTPDTCLTLRVHVGGGEGNRIFLDFLRQELGAQLNVPLVPTVNPPPKERGITTSTDNDKLWDLRVRFTDFLRRFLSCYFPPRGRRPDAFTVFFVRGRKLSDGSDWHIRSGFFGHNYFIDQGQKDYLTDWWTKLTDEDRKKISVDAIYRHFLPLGDGICSEVYLTAAPAVAKQVTAVTKGYSGTDKALEQLENTILRDRTLMEIPVYDDLPMIDRSTPDGPSLILCVAILNTQPNVQDQIPESVQKRITPLLSRQIASYRCGEEEVTREFAQRMTRRFLSSPTAVPRLPEVIGRSPAMEKVFEAIETVAPTEASVLITGESGTGKEVVANAIHALSGRNTKPMAVIHCGSLQETLLESELFGYVKGAFTGANGAKQGLFEAADGSTAFLDEISEISAKTQVDLLRVLQNKEIKRLGSTKSIKVNFRCVAATNSKLENLVKQGDFREDLYYRLKVFVIDVPPLRQRKEDIPLLADHFVRKFSTDYRKRVIGISAKAMDRLQKYSWPGNVRELEHEIERAVVICQGSELEEQHLSTDVRSATEFDMPGLGRSLGEVELAYILQVITETDGDESRAAEILGIDRITLRKKLEQRVQDGASADAR